MSKSCGICKHMRVLKLPDKEASCTCLNLDSYANKFFILTEKHYFDLKEVQKEEPFIWKIWGVTCHIFDSMED